MVVVVVGLTSLPSGVGGLKHEHDVEAEKDDHEESTKVVFKPPPTTGTKPSTRESASTIVQDEGVLKALAKITMSKVAKPGPEIFSPANQHDEKRNHLEHGHESKRLEYGHESKRLERTAIKQA